VSSYSDYLKQAYLKPELFNELLNGPLSSRIAYLAADLCPCADSRGSGPAEDCPRCGGLGWTWESKVPSQTRSVELTRNPHPSAAHRERLTDAGEITAVVDEDGVSYPPESITVRPDGSVIWTGAAPEDYKLYTVTTISTVLRAGVQGVTAQREFQTRGMYDVMDVEMTIDRHLADKVTKNPAWDCGEFDRFVLVDAWRRHAQRVRRGMDKVIYRRAQGVQIKALIGGQLVTYTPGADFVFDDGQIQWATGKGPARNEYYAFTGMINPEYYVFQGIPQVRHEDGLELPRRIVLKGFENFPTQRPAQAF